MVLNSYYLSKYSFYYFIQKFIFIIVYLIELGIEITTLYLLHIFKKELNTVPNTENQINILPSDE